MYPFFKDSVDVRHKSRSDSEFEGLSCGLQRIKEGKNKILFMVKRWQGGKVAQYSFNYSEFQGFRS